MGPGLQWRGWLHVAETIGNFQNLYLVILGRTYMVINVLSYESNDSKMYIYYNKCIFIH